MLKFFRKIRQKLLSENKFSKYILYAIGEIILVVIGILIALQINNWNEARKISSSEVSYLNALKAEFEVNQSKLQSVTRINENNLKYARELSELMGKDDSAISVKELRAIIIRIVNAEAQYRPSNGVINEILNSGKLEIFKSDSLRFMISSWNGELMKVRFQEQDEVHISRQNLFNIIFKKTNVKEMVKAYDNDAFLLTESKLTSNELALLQSLELENALVRFIASSYYLDYRYRELHKVQGSLLNKIAEIQRL